MEPVPGYEAANWGKGYGDFVMKPDLNTLMKASLARGHGHRARATSVDHHHHEPIPHSPRAILKAPDRPACRHGLHLQRRLRARVLPVRRGLSAPLPRRGMRGPQTAGYYIEDYHIFQTTKEEGVMRALRKQLQASGIPVEKLQGRVGPRAGRDQRQICRGAHHGGPPCGDQERHQGNRLLGQPARP